MELQKTTRLEREGAAENCNDKPRAAENDKDRERGAADNDKDRARGGLQKTARIEREGLQMIESYRKLQGSRESCRKRHGCRERELQKMRQM